MLWKPLPPVDTPMPYIDVEKDSGSYIHALIKAPAPTQVLAVSEYATAQQWLEQWSQATGVASRAEQVDLDLFRGDDPTGFMGMMIETSGFIEELGFAGGDKRILMPEEVSCVAAYQLNVDNTDSLTSWRNNMASPSVVPSWLTISPVKTGLRSSDRSCDVVRSRAVIGLL
jgi:hypothetical protein